MVHSKPGFPCLSLRNAEIAGASTPGYGETFVLSEDSVTGVRGPGLQPTWRLEWVCSEPGEGKNPGASSLPVIYHYGNGALFRCPCRRCWGRIVDATAVQVTVPSSFPLQKCHSNLRGPARTLPLTPEGPGLGKNNQAGLPRALGTFWVSEGQNNARAEQCGLSGPAFSFLWGASGVRGLKMDLQALR